MVGHALFSSRCLDELYGSTVPQTSGDVASLWYEPIPLNEILADVL